MLQQQKYDVIFTEYPDKPVETPYQYRSGGGYGTGKNDGAGAHLVVLR